MLDMGSISWNLRKSWIILDDLGILVNLSKSWRINISESEKSWITMVHLGKSISWNLGKSWKIDILES